MAYPQFDYRLGEPLTWEDVKAREVAKLNRERERMEALLNWRPSEPKRKTQSGVPVIPLKEKE